MYRPPDARICWMDDFGVMMERAANERGERIVMGDFNCNMLSVPRGCGLEQVTAEYGLSQLINMPTRYTPTSYS